MGPGVALTPCQYTFLTFLAIFELGSLLCGVAPSSDMLIVGRAVAGMGSSGLMNGALTIVAACVPLDKRPRKKSCPDFLSFLLTRP
jgi:predicted MFS family arabinose efflux permease